MGTDEAITYERFVFETIKEIGIGQYRFLLLQCLKICLKDQK